MNNPAIEAWSAAIREACDRYSDYLVSGEYGTQGICCCAGGALLFDLDFDADDGNCDFAWEDILTAMEAIHTDQKSGAFLGGLVGAFDGHGERDGLLVNCPYYTAGHALGRELRAKYRAQLEAA